MEIGRPMAWVIGRDSICEPFPEAVVHKARFSVDISKNNLKYKVAKYFQCARNNPVQKSRILFSDYSRQPMGGTLKPVGWLRRPEKFLGADGNWLSAGVVVVVVLMDGCRKTPARHAV